MLDGICVHKDTKKLILGFFIVLLKPKLWLAYEKENIHSYTVCYRLIL